MTKINLSHPLRHILHLRETPPFAVRHFQKIPGSSSVLNPAVVDDKPSTAQKNSLYLRAESKG
jgi:hypothetical protein